MIWTYQHNEERDELYVFVLWNFSVKMITANMHEGMGMIVLCLPYMEVINPQMTPETLYIIIEDYHIS